MSLKGYYEASLCPPAEDDVFAAAAAAAKWDWGEALLDRAAYMVDKKNHTSARCRFRRDVLDKREVEMRVTLCLAPPPLVSYFCCHAYYADDKGEDNRLFISEPSMFAMEGDLALITLCHGEFHPSAIDNNKGYYEYLVYQAGKEELTRLPHPDPWMLPNERSHCFNSTSIAVVPCSSKFPTSVLSPSVTGPSQDDDACGAYKIAALGKDFFHDSANGPHYLCIYDSKTEAWTRKAGAIPQPLLPPSDFISDMTITIGGKSGGIVGWVDLWSGTLLSDVLADDTPFHQFRYVPLPEPRQPPNRLPLAVDIATAFRDIVLVKETGIIRFVDLQVHGQPGNPFSEIPSGWTVVTWTMEGLRRDSVTLGDMRFKPEHEVHSCDIENYDLPKSVFVSNPILSSHKDGILYLRTTVSSKTDRNSRVIAVDIKNKKLLKVGEFDMRRPNTYRRTTISSYLKPPVSKENMKRRAPVSMGSSRKKPQQQPAITNPAEGGEVYVGDVMDLQ
ncbi:uncharacterized protein LOC119267220 [Triticum dicoccoides]|uniref:DUF1618 domain-containing protein n=1 Tax=Triticum turgidum subsp. durum TaxID=4567 RepID=A0A9R0RCB9_TRITD|nr:uncharacterized protein LOC119267220 [Triticum dicoccoides]VAH57785.1 unnamed protein product [Triticum turgidum subsp. durum]